MSNLQTNVFLSVIIPAYNEAERIETTLERISRYLKQQPYPYEIIVVNDASKDATAEKVEKLKREIIYLSLLNTKNNRGKGYAVREGMLAARGRIRLFTDADNSTDISHFELMRPFFDKGYEAVICSRDKKDAVGARQSVPQSRFKRLLGNLGNLFVQLVAVPGIWDTQCGFKAFRDFAAKEIFSRARIDRWGFDIEVLALARALKYKIGIVPADWKNDPFSHVKIASYFQVLWETIRVKWYLTLGKYNLK
ncbi:MAG: glycosyltransferase family 2 protein [Candidatus Niyogibacteria bacterium]|nr:glycosyltransferase family 2 protein [Candidatus Niyogibacteria bacterium]